MPLVYILRCSDNTLYVGHTDDLDARQQAHNSGHATQYTAARRPVHLAYSEGFNTPAEAINRERQLKRWSAKKKEALIAGHLSNPEATQQTSQEVSSAARRHRKPLAT